MESGGVGSQSGLATAFKWTAKSHGINIIGIAKRRQISRTRRKADER